jgi:hypothetical protein
VFWASVLVVEVRRWLAGGRAWTPLVLGISILLAVAGFILASLTAASELGSGLLIGAAIGCMSGNVWAIRAARQNRPVRPGIV